MLGYMDETTEEIELFPVDICAICQDGCEEGQEIRYESACSGIYCF